MAGDEQDSAGPSSPPPPLPEGWLAQWEGVSRKWYYVQRATGKSQWDVPTEPVILTPSTTPGSIGTGPTQAPGPGTQSPNSQTIATGSPDMDGTRGLFNSSAMRPILSGVLGSHGNSGLTQIADKMINEISKDFGASNKYTNNASNNSSPLNPNNSTSHASHGQGPNSIKPQAEHNSYGYTSMNQQGTYAGSAPQYHPQGQAISQQGQFSHHPEGSHGPFGSAGPTEYQHYHTANQPVPSNQFSSMNSVPQPWQSQNSFAHNTPPSYQPPMLHGQNNGPPMSMPPQPEWQIAAHPTVTHSIQTNPNNPVMAPNQPPPHKDYPPPYYQQVPQPYQNQPTQNAYAHGQMTQDFPHHPQNPQGLQPTQHNLAQHANNFEQNTQPLPYQGPQHPPPYNSGGGMMSGASPVPSNFQNNAPMNPASGAMSATVSQQGNLSHQSSLATLSNHYPGNNVPNSATPNNHAFAVELPDNQTNANRPPPINMQSHPSAGQHHGQPFMQGSVPQNPPQPLPNPMAVELSGAEPMRQTPTDPQFVSGPWTSPPATSNHHYPPNRYNNPGGF